MSGDSHENENRGNQWGATARVLLPLTGLVLVALGVAVLLRHVFRPSRPRGDAEDRAAGHAPAARPAPPGKADAEPGDAPLAVRTGDRVRTPVVAGQFYPGTSDELRRQIDELLGAAPGVGLRKVRALVVPHAGYVFSGGVAADAYRELDTGFRRVFVLACNHTQGADYSGAALPPEARFAVPGGEVPVAAAADALAKDPLFPVVPEAHASHVIEVQLPFLLGVKAWPAQPDFALVPMVLGRMTDAGRAHLADVLDREVDERTVFVVSSDLSHYENDETARKLDEATLEAILARDAEQLRDGLSCGADALRVLLEVAHRRGWETTLLRYANSGDASGDRSRVVGYGAVAFTDPLNLNNEESEALLDFTRKVVESKVRDRHKLEPDAEWLARYPIFRVPRGVFVTLKHGGELRGCIGRIVTQRPLWESVRDCAIDAAVSDLRFLPVTPSELPGLHCSISVLNHPCRVKTENPDALLARLRPGQDGVILRLNDRQSTYLPQVWDQIPDRTEFLESLAKKAGCPPDAWRDPAARLYTYGAHVIGEETDTGR